MSRADDLSRSLDLARVVASYGIELQREGAEQVACCPFHQEDTPSFRVYFDKPQNKPRWKCFGCSTSGDVIDFVQQIEGLPDARAAMDRLQAFDATTPLPPLTSKKPAMKKTKPGRILAEYDYHDAAGEFVFQVVRRELLNESGDPLPGKKTFMQRRRSGSDWAWNLDGVQRVLYRLPFLIGAETVWLTEGEKDVHSLEQLGIVATTIPGGAKASWQHGYTDSLRGKHVVLCCDTDKPGQEHQARCLTHLSGAAASLSICHLPELCKDVTEFIEAGQDPRDLVRPWEPPAPSPSPAGSPDPEPQPKPRPPAAAKPERAATVTVESEPVGNWRSWLLFKADGYNPKPVFANAVTAFRLAPEWAGKLFWDEFALRVVFRTTTPWGAGGSGELIWTDQETNLAAEWLQRNDIMVTPNVVGQAIHTVAHEKRFHPVRDYLKSLNWDGMPRLDNWLIEYMHAEPGNYTAAVGAAWMISAVARVMHPGSKVDTALVFEGEQGVGKSSALRALGEPWFSDDLADMGTKDSAIQVAGVWILELAELDAMGRPSVEKVKGRPCARSRSRRRPSTLAAHRWARRRRLPPLLTGSSQKRERSSRTRRSLRSRRIPTNCRSTSRPSWRSSAR